MGAVGGVDRLGHGVAFTEVAHDVAEDGVTGVDEGPEQL